MEEIVRGIDPNLEYQWSEIDGEIMRMYVESVGRDGAQPYAKACFQTLRTKVLLEQKWRSFN